MANTNTVTFSTAQRSRKQRRTDEALKRRALTPKQAAAYIGWSESFLAHGRSNGQTGKRTPTPPFIRVGRHVRYLVEDLDAWLAQFNRQFTLAEEANPPTPPRKRSA